MPIDNPEGHGLRSDKVDFICPKCSSDNVVVMKRTGYAIVLSLLFLGLPLPWFKKSYYCFDCENEWKDK